MVWLYRSPIPMGGGGVLVYSGGGWSATCGFHPNHLFPSLYLPSHISSPRMPPFFPSPGPYTYFTLNWPTPPSPYSASAPYSSLPFSLLPIPLSIPPATSSPISFLPRLPPHSPSSLCLRHSILQLPSCILCTPERLLHDKVTVHTDYFPLFPYIQHALLV